MKQAPGWPVLQAEGTLNALLLLVDFDDKPASVGAGYFDTLVFGTSPPSVRDYFREVSFGKLDIVTVNLPSASDWFGAPENYDYYVDGKGGGGSYPRNAQRLVEDLVKLADPLIDFSEYDNNGDGYVDILMVVHAGTGREATGDDNDIHSHAWRTSTAVSVDGVKVHHYAVMPEYWPRDWADLPNMTIGVFAHELGHIFGLPDLYDTDGSSHGVGRWCLMGASSWNGLVNGELMGSSPAHPSAWARIELGWTSPG
ncbi:M6 family metalloprotease domain-containing protein [Dehalococcoidia bacterium]|nr:M6 family metalloprotease domain-containing protein [Dehalococcoidia bacterium]